VLLKRTTLAGIADGSIRTVYRRWEAPRVKAGATFKTAIGVLEVAGIEAVTRDALTDRAAREAGHASRDALRAELAKHGSGRLYRITLRRAGPDPRLALRERTALSADEHAALAARLARLGASSATGPWALGVLRLLAARPGVRAADLARTVGLETLRFKARVRQLKELGLTESLEVGYRLSPRGHAFLARASDLAEPAAAPACRSEAGVRRRRRSG
jgi:hypothetical protein